MHVKHILEKFEDSPRFDCHKEKTTKERKNGTRVFFNVVHKPNEAMDAVHQEIIQTLTERLKPFYHSLPNAISVAGVTSKSIFYRLERQRYITKLDLFHAYGSVKVALLAEVLKDLFPSWGSEKQIAIFLRKYCCNEKLGLFYGAPASPLLFNLYCEKLIDVKIRALINLWGGGGIVYMRYIDDFIFSSRYVKIARDFLFYVRKIIQEAGFLENQWKAKSIDRNQGPIIVLGRQLGCLALMIQMNWRVFSKSPNVKRKTKELRQGVDPHYQGMPRRVVGMPARSSEKISVETLEQEMYRASRGGNVEKPASLCGKMTWFVDTIYPQGRALSRIERKLVTHFIVWAKKTNQKIDFLNKLNFVIKS